jgi:hypothetical protein
MTNNNPITGWFCFNGSHIIRDPSILMEFNPKIEGATTAYCPDHPPAPEPSYDARLDPNSPHFDFDAWFES